MRQFRDVGFKAVYRTDTDNLLADFYLPMLECAVQYDRAVGFFSAHTLSAAAQGLSALFRSRGAMRLIVGAELDSDTEAAILRGEELRGTSSESHAARHIMGMLEKNREEIVRRRYELLAYMLACGRLDVKVALRRRGMYHEKIGIAYDSTGDFVVFQGSMNETPYALMQSHNFESINVFPGWRPEFHDHWKPHVEAFERLWNDSAPPTVVLPLPAAVKHVWYRLAGKLQPDELPTPEEEQNLVDPLPSSVNHADLPREPFVPTRVGGRPFELRPHQRRALFGWQSHDFKGIFAHATGAGKTLTAIYGIVKVFESTQRLAVVISVPYVALADQWVKQLRDFGIAPHQCYDSRTSWLPGLTQEVALYRAGSVSFLCCVVVNKTLRDSDEFRNAIAQIPGERLLFVGDECHHHGSVAYQDALPRHANLRLGLSATPGHYAKEDFNSRLTAYYGDWHGDGAIYGIEEALADGYLTPYKYFVVPVYLTLEEMDAYTQLTAELAQALAGGSQGTDSMTGAAGAIAGKRARVLALAEGKLSVLQAVMRKLQPTPLTLVYVGEGSTEDESGVERRMVETVGNMLDSFGWKVARFTAQEGRREREDILSRFSTGLIDALVAMKCLDEGIDIPACATAFMLASSRNPRQFVQRRGRVLRRAPGKEFANIYDFVVLPPRTSDIGQTATRGLVKDELERVAQFCKLSMNPEQSWQMLRFELDEYELNHLLV